MIKTLVNIIVETIWAPMMKPVVQQAPTEHSTVLVSRCGLRFLYAPGPRDIAQDLMDEPVQIWHNYKCAFINITHPGEEFSPVACETGQIRSRQSRHLRLYCSIAVARLTLYGQVGPDGFSCQREQRL